MNNKDFIVQLAQRSGYTQEETQRLVRSVIDSITNRLEENEAVVLPNFGTFEVKKRLERVMINPTTKQRMLVPPKLVLNFRPVASIKEFLKNGGEENE